tara:strand:- start:2177 stop:2530 length:354 start_codon:yes stop_codon:yes gene_type:complete
MSYKTFTAASEVYPVKKSNRPAVEPLGTPGAAYQKTAGAGSDEQDLTANITRISMLCRTADARYEIGTTGATVTANASTSHFIAKDERLDLKVPLNGRIAFIRDDSDNATLEITELS